MLRNAARYNTIVNVKNFSAEMTNDELNEMFATFGIVNSCKIMNGHCDESLRFAYVAFVDPDAAEDAIIELNGQKISDDPDSQRLRVRRTHPKYPSLVKPKAKASERQRNEPRIEKESCNEDDASKPNDGLTIFVNYLECWVSTETLRNVFGGFGTISSAKIIIENGQSKGYGFVTFSTPEGANSAVIKGNGYRLGTKKLRVELARGKARNVLPGAWPPQRRPIASHVWTGSS